MIIYYIWYLKNHTLERSLYNHYLNTEKTLEFSKKSRNIKK
jgi:hypothetical protein